MSAQRGPSALREVLSRDTMPVFLAAGFWSFGTGGLWLVRPLFAYEVGGTFLLVALIAAASSFPRMIAGPATGFLTDRFGRRPFVIIGAALHAAALIGDFFVDTYTQFLMLELLNGLGIAIFSTSATVLLADATRERTRGRAMSARQVSGRIGSLTGPMVAGVVAAAFGLQAVFLFVAATKIAVIAVAVFLIREVRERPPQPAADQPPAPKRDLGMFRTRAFVSLTVATVALGMVTGGTGVFRALFPVQTEIAAGLSETQIGNLISFAALAGLAGSVPIGIAIDRYGRKRPLIAGLIVSAVAVYIMGVMGSFAAALAAVLVFGFAEVLAMSARQVYAMDLAPVERRGAFLGVSQGTSNIGQITGPLLIGQAADAWGFAVAFGIVAAALVVAAVVTASLGRETYRRGQGDPAVDPARP